MTCTFDPCKVRTPDGGCSAYQTRTGTAKSTQTIQVLAPPVINAFTATPSTSMAGRPVVLSWAVANATSISIPGVDVGSGTSATVNPTATRTYTLTATNEVASVQATVTVSTYVVAVSLNPATASLALGETRSFSATVTPANQGVSWSATGGSMNNGSFTALVPGTFVVTATSLEDPGKSASATVTVSDAALSAVTPANPTMYAGTPFTFTAGVNGAIDQGVAWSVDGGATISATGVFRAATVGSYTVRATSTANPARTATTTATVKSAVTGVTLTPSSTTLALGRSLAFAVQVGVLAGDSTAVTWSCVGGTITASGWFTAPQSEGVCTVQATSVQDPSKVATATVLVQKASITLSPEGRTMNVGKTIQFISTLTGEANTQVTWSASGAGASISSSGLFTADAPGTCTVTATSVADPQLTVSTTVNVRVPSTVPVWKRDIIYLGGQVVGEVEASGKIHTTLTDHLGTPRIVVGSDGVVELEQKYLPFGQLLWQVGSLTTGKGFTNHEQTDPSGLIYMQARFYLPQYGRFASPDPARDQHFEQTQSWNIYSYVQNNPVMMTDPNGENAKYTFDYAHRTMRISVPNYMINESGGNSKALASRYAGDANKAWNNNGKGWNVDLGKKGQWHVEVSFGCGTTPNEVAKFRKDEGITASDQMATNNVVVKAGGRSGEVTDTSTVTLGAQNMIAGPHEGGHEMGHPDAYNRTSSGDTPISNSWKGNVMAEPPGQGVVDMRNIQFLAGWALDQAKGKDSLVVNAEKRPVKEDLK